tara:strand:+ start:259 stop:468 length:210 start_codon:yes stop_codon:yes gene_type:complete
MIITNEDRLNLIDVLLEWEGHPDLGPKELDNNDVGLDSERYTDIMQRLIDKEDKYESKNKVQANDCSQN